MFYQMFRSGARMNVTDYSYTRMVCGGENTKAAYYEVIDSTEQNAIGFVVFIQDQNTLADYLLDIAIGAAGSEVIVLPNLYVGGHKEDYSMHVGGFVVLPIPLPAGTRVSVRGQTNYSLAGEVDLTVMLITGGDLHSNAPLSVVDTYGANTSESDGTDVTVDEGAFSSWVEITSGITENIKGFFLSLVDNNTVYDGEFYARLDIGVGSAGNEVKIVDGLPINVRTGGYEGNYGSIWPKYTPFFPISIASGQRVVVRVKGNIAYSIGVILHGLR